MAHLGSILYKALNFNKMLATVGHIEYKTDKINYLNKEQVRKKIIVHVTPFKRVQKRCPVCKNLCPGYDHKKEQESMWRTVDLNGIPVYLSYRPQRIECSEHGILTEYIPWSDGNSRFTEDFNNEIAYLASKLSKSCIAEYMQINWRTVGNCLKAAHSRLEPDIRDRLRGLSKICVDETSYKKGHSYITVVYDMERNRVVWIHEGHGTEVFKQFCEAIPEEERKNIKVVAGDGARWIDSCTKEYFPNAKRCIDIFHVVSWANEKLDEVRIEASNKANKEYEKMKEHFIEIQKSLNKQIRELEEELESMPTRGRPSKRKLELLEIINKLKNSDDFQNISIKSKKRGRKPKYQFSTNQEEKLEKLEQTVKTLKGLRYALGHNPENCTEAQEDKIKLMENSYPDLYKSYQQKEALRLILRLKDIDFATSELDKWIIETNSIGIKPMSELAEKIDRHRENILNSIKFQANSAKSEATNTSIKCLINMARGFRNLENMFALIYLKCSDLIIPLNNRILPSHEEKQKARDRANQRRSKI